MDALRHRHRRRRDHARDLQPLRGPLGGVQRLIDQTTITSAPTESQGKKKRRWGVFSLGLAALATYLLTVSYAGFGAALIDSPEVVIALAGVATLVLPLLLGWKLKMAGPRFLAALNLLALGALLFFAGETVERVLAQHGAKVFVPLGDSAAVTGTGKLTVDLLRYAARRGEEEPPELATDGGRASDGDGGMGSPYPVPSRPDAGSPLDAGALPVVERPVVDAGSPEPEVPPTPTPTPTDPEVLVIPISPGGSTFEVGAMVNGKVPTSFVFDSGAHDVSITSALARRLGLDASDAIEWRTYLTANGKVRQPVVTIESIDLGEGFSVEDVEGSICEGCSDNLLGRSFQKHFLIEIDSKAAEVRLRRN